MEESDVTRPLVTIGLSTYNRAEGYLREALESALAQRYEPLEIVVVDNASTDGTADLVASLADERVRYVRHEVNVGANGNFNACLKHARGAYFLLLHDDDRIDADLVEACMAAVEARGDSDLPGLVRTGVRIMDAAGAVQSERRNEARVRTGADLAFAWFEGRTSMYFCNTMYLTEALRDDGGFHTKHELYIDAAAVFRIAARLAVVDVPEVLASFRRHGGNNGTAQSIEAWCEDSLEVLDLIVASAPEHATELRRMGTNYFTANNYTRASRLNDVTQRWRAYWTVYRCFGFRTSPLRFTARRRWKHALADTGTPSA
jgi:glycosyltransferase involved in cell wall biosynthesis